MRRWRAVLAIALCGSMVAQTPQPPPAHAPASTKSLSAQERRELLGSVDAILQFASEDSGLPIRRTVRPRLVSRGEVMRYLTERFAEDESAKRLERSELVLKKFGLLPREFNLKPFLLRLLTEQIAGYYDSKTKTVNLLNWVAAEEQKPVLAHELTHALQDQAVGLERWSDSGVNGVARTAAEQAEHVRLDEWETARDAVAEGQAMLVYTDYALRSTQHTLLDSPEVLERLLTVDPGAGGESSPVLVEAPRVLQESLLFPYTEGLAFEAALLRDGGTPRAFVEVLARPPASSYEVMTPRAYLAHEAAPVLRLPDVNAVLGADWAPYDVGVIGELDARMLAESYGDAEDAKALAAAWDGGVYYAAQRVATKGETARGTGSIGLAYLSRWKDAEAARRFAALYQMELPRKYRRVVSQVGEKVTDLPPDEGASATWFDTDEGEVLIAVHARSVFVAEGFPAALEERLRGEVLGANAHAEVATAYDVHSPEAIPRKTLVSGLISVLGATHYTSLGMSPRREPAMRGPEIAK